VDKIVRLTDKAVDARLAGEATQRSITVQERIKQVFESLKSK